MTGAIYVDSAAFIALADEGDSHHARAKAFSESLPAGARLATSDMVCAETFSNLLYGLGAEAARTFSRAILTGEGAVEVLFPDCQDLVAAQRTLDKYRDQTFSLVDCVSFALMERHKMTRAFTFDRHFAVYRPAGGRFQVLPEK